MVRGPTRVTSTGTNGACSSEAISENDHLTGTKSPSGKLYLSYESLAETRRKPVIVAGTGALGGKVIHPFRFQKRKLAKRLATVRRTWIYVLLFAWH